MKRDNQDRKAGKAKLSLNKETIRELALGDVERSDGARAEVDPRAGALASPAKTFSEICC